MSTHESFRRDEPVKGSSDRSFGIVFAVVFVAIACWPLLHGGALRTWALIVAVGFALAAFLRPSILAPLNRRWTRFGLLLHRIVNPLVMAILFFGVITPAALVMRLLGKDPLRRRLDAKAESYWIERQPPGPAADTMRNQF